MIPPPSPQYPYRLHWSPLPPISFYTDASRLVADHYEMPDQRSSSEEKFPDPRQFLNPVYGSESSPDGELPSSTAAAATAVPQPGEELDDHQYSSVTEVEQEADRKFNNPIYGDDLQSNVYSQTSHMTAHPATQPQAQVRPLEPNAQYGSLETPAEMPPDSNGHVVVSGGRNDGFPKHDYEDADAPPSSAPAPSEAIYNEIEEHNYSMLENNHWLDEKIIVGFFFYLTLT